MSVDENCHSGSAKAPSNHIPKSSWHQVQSTKEIYTRRKTNLFLLLAISTFEVSWSAIQNHHAKQIKMAPHLFTLKILKEQLLFFLETLKLYLQNSDITDHSALLLTIKTEQPRELRHWCFLSMRDQTRNQHHQWFTAFQLVTSSGQQRPEFTCRTTVFFNWLPRQNN